MNAKKKPPAAKGLSADSHESRLNARRGVMTWWACAVATLQQIANDADDLARLLRDPDHVLFGVLNADTMLKFAQVVSDIDSGVLVAGWGRDLTNIPDPFAGLPDRTPTGGNES